MKRADHHLIQQVLDGDVSPETFVRFQQRLREEPDLFKYYEEYALLHHTLSEEFEGGGAVHSAPVEHAGSVFRIPWLLASAAVLALAATAWLFVPWTARQAVEDVAVVTFSVDAVWQIEGASRNLGAATGIAQGGKLHLTQGRASISFEPTVIAVVEGPAEVEIPEANTLHLSQGRGYFHRGGTGGGLVVTTPKFTAVDYGTEFGIVVSDDGPDELQMMDGKVVLVSKSSGESMALAEGDSVRVPATGSIARVPADSKPFAKDLGRFKSVVSGPFEKSKWRVDYGNPAITGERIDGENYAMFLPLPISESEVGSPLVLVTLDVGKSNYGEFHTDGWAGLSVFSGGREALFFGDSFGTAPVWSLDVKQRVPVIVPEHPVSGPGVITLRYDPRSGEVTLHEGAAPLKPAFCRGKIVPGTRFDEIRIGASSGAALAVKSLHIRMCED